MKTYCVSCNKKTANGNYGVRRTKQKRLKLVSNCAVCDHKKLRFIKNQEVHYEVFNNCFVSIKIKLNKIVSKFLLAGDQFMLELHLR